MADHAVSASLEEALEGTFWKWAGRAAVGARCPETWKAVAVVAREHLSTREDALLQARIERLADLVRFARHHLHNEDLISDEEFAALVMDSDKGQRVARLETYDEVRARNARMRAALERCCTIMSDAASVIGEHPYEDHPSTSLALLIALNQGIEKAKHALDPEGR